MKRKRKSGKLLILKLWFLLLVFAFPELPDKIQYSLYYLDQPNSAIERS